MIENRSSDIDALKARVAGMAEYLHLEAKRGDLAALEAKTGEPDFWDDQSTAQAVMAQASGLRDEIEAYEAVVSALDDTEVANELAVAENDEELAREVAANITEIARKSSSLEVASWFNGEFDAGDAILTITPGQGGLEAQDWAEMLLRIYTKYAESKKWKVDLHDAPAGVELGIDRAVFTVHGRNAYGMLSSEMGVHRLVRISPTDEKKRRQTTFAGIEVLPVLPDDVAVDLKEDDLRIDVYRSSGPGGQSVNTTDSAVRITHIPSGLVVTCQNEKSQHKNKDAAMMILRSRLYELEKAKRDAEIDELRGPKRDITFGSQIRNYVLYPYQLVKDVRTGVETGNVDAVLGGDIDDFVVGYHRWRVHAEQAAEVGSISGGE
ncbi:MAG: peptide chain release factor 2 [Actinobacteria bacterium HGW-Actinobacteria-7]|nr:MAG: peptide chain release factor 2 [Actinobacteria bacterium HGW-Actinobacteria-7]